MTRSVSASLRDMEPTPPLALSLPARVTGVVLRPGETFRSVVARPSWLSVLVAATLLATIPATLFMSTAVGRQALVDQWERTALAFGQPVDDAAYASLQQASTMGPAYAIGTALLVIPGLTFALAGLLVAGLGARRSGVTFRQVLALTAHASVILAIRQAIAAPVSYARESTANATSLGVWFQMLDEASPLARFLGSLDLFVIWWLIVLAVGLATLYGRRARTLAMALIGLYAMLALILAAAMALSGGTT